MPSGFSARRLKLVCHVPVRNAGILKFFAICNKTMAFVESDGVCLRVEVQDGMSLSPGAIHQKLKNCPADTATAPFMQHRHTPDMAIRQQTTGTDGAVMHIKCQCMQRHRIKFIPFQRLRHLLFNDENRTTQLLQLREIALPRGGPHFESGW